MIFLEVWVRLEKGSLARAGDLAFGDADAQGRFPSEFQYANEWLRERATFALDPVGLPPGTQRYAAQGLRPSLAVFEDALPDAWGRRLLIMERRLPAGKRGVPFLLRELGADGLGALAFSPAGEPAPATRSDAVVHLDDLMAAADAFERGIPVPAERLRRLLAAGSTPGGARPKALVRDGANVEWIAKFPSVVLDGGLDVVGLEAACLVMAHAAGIEVPEAQLARVGAGRRALLVRRFDIAPAGGRRHMVSLRTLCRDSPENPVGTYTELAERIRLVSAHPAEDVARFFRRMVFNAAIGNTDDHLKNFWMLRHAEGYRLTPAFDLVPDVGGNREHVLAFRFERLPPSRRDLLEVARGWGVVDAGTGIDAVVRAVSDFVNTARQCGVARTSIERFRADIDERLERLRR